MNVYDTLSLLTPVNEPTLSRFAMRAYVLFSTKTAPMRTKGGKQQSGEKESIRHAAERGPIERKQQ